MKKGQDETKVSAKVRYARRRSKRNPGFNQSWWALYRSAIIGLCGTTAHVDDSDSAASLVARAAQIADAGWSLWNMVPLERSVCMDERIKGLSDRAREVARHISIGTLLRVPHDGSEARLYCPPLRPQHYGQVPVRAAVVIELLACRGLLGKLTEHRSNQKTGWRELGITDGDEADYWCPVQ